MSRMATGVLLLSAVTLIAGLSVAWLAYRRDMGRAYERINNRSKVTASPFGTIEYREGGSGPAVLVIHGSGGGFDQGELLVRALLGNDFRWIAPSRFGYLRSTFRKGATFDDQAHAYAHLLDKLGIQKVAVVTISHGGPSALLFALLHPNRVSSVTLVSAGVASRASANQAQANQKGNMLVSIFKRDLFYWAVTRVFRKQLMELMGASEEVIARLTAPHKEVIDQLIDYMNPVAPRFAGTMFDNKAALPGKRIAGIRSPTLILHATDDTLQLFHNATFAEQTIPGARLVRFERGGHLLLSVEQARIQSLTREHILRHLAGPGCHSGARSSLCRLR